ncbi:hypothetical protein D920_02923 [Enterococcus faecalis 13-SD-W-01]|nr:hypothetical protein D920_02923 [Enterococcus faecalis 13-SD-W-01]
MKPKISREEVKKLLVSDVYFEKKHYLLKIFQTIIAIIGWIFVVVPFIWVLLPFIAPEIARENHFLVYTEELQTLKFLFIFFCIMFVVIAVVYILLTRLNNYRFKNLLQKEVQYNEERLNIRRRLLEEDYEVRFGPEEFRKTVCFYSVKGEQNLDTEFVRDLYKKGGVKL